MANNSVRIEIELKDGNALKALKSIDSKLKDTSKKGNSLSLSLGSAFKIAGVDRFLGLLGRIPGMLAKIGTAAVKAFSAFAFESAKVSDELDRVQWKFDIVFRHMRKTANTSAKEIAQAYNRNIGTIQQSMGNISDVLKPIGISEKMALKMSSELTKLSQSAKEWSLGHRDARTASISFMKALAGEKEMLKEMGIVIRDQDLFDYIESQGAALDDVTRAYATYNMILKRSQDMQRAAGDRIDSLSDKLFQLSDAFNRTLKGAVGEYFKPLMKALTDLGIAVSQKMAEILGAGGFEGWEDVLDTITQKVTKLTNVINEIDVSTWRESLTEIFKDIKARLGNIWKDFWSLGKNVITELGQILGQQIAEGLKSGFGFGKKSGSGGSPGVLDFAFMSPEEYEAFLKKRRERAGGTSTADRFKRIDDNFKSFFASIDSEIESGLNRAQKTVYQNRTDWRNMYSSKQRAEYNRRLAEIRKGGDPTKVDSTELPLPRMTAEQFHDEFVQQTKGAKSRWETTVAKLAEAEQRKSELESQTKPRFEITDPQSAFNKLFKRAAGQEDPTDIQKKILTEQKKIEKLQRDKAKIDKEMRDIMKSIDKKQPQKSTFSK